MKDKEEEVAAKEADKSDDSESERCASSASFI